MTFGFRPVGAIPSINPLDINLIVFRIQAAHLIDQRRDQVSRKSNEKSIGKNNIILNSEARTPAFTVTRPTDRPVQIRVAAP